MPNFSENIMCAFIDSVKEVFSTMIHLNVSNVDKKPVYAEEVDCIASHILLKNKDMIGICQILVERELALKICKSMTGMDFEISDSIVDDTVGELINIFLGFAKSKLKEEEDKFDIAPPFLITGKNLKIDGKLGTKIYTKYFNVEGNIFTLRLIYA